MDRIERPAPRARAVDGSFGGSWSAAATVGAGTATSSAAPSACSDGTNLVAAYKGDASAGLFLSTLSGSSWGGHVVVPGGDSPVGPALACAAPYNTITVFWRTTADRLAYEDVIAGGFTRHVDLLAGVQSAGAPAASGCDSRSVFGLTSTADSMALAWTSLAGRVQYNLREGSSTSWVGVTSLPTPTSVGGPSLAGGDAAWGTDPGDLTLYAAWTTSGSSIRVAASDTPSGEPEAAVRPRDRQFRTNQPMCIVVFRSEVKWIRNELALPVRVADTLAIPTPTTGWPWIVASRMLL